jgi:hypothetical protein
MRKKSDLRDAQQRTIDRLYNFAYTQAVLGMGAGKTACALTAYAELKADGHMQDMFVLAPKRVSQLVWPREVREWEHLQHVKVVWVSGTAAQRLAALRQPADIYAIGVDNTKWFVEWAEKQNAARFSRSVLCIDESSRFKNPRGVRGKALAKLTDKSLFGAVWELTGTPRPNGYEDQFMPIRLLTGGKLWGRSFDKWRDERFMPLDWNGYKWSIRPEWRQRTIADINSVSITIPIEDMPDLPDLNDGPDFIEWVDMPREVKPVYDEMKRHLVAQIEAGTVAAANMAVASGKLEQIIQGFLYEPGSRAAQRIHDVKMEALLELVEAAGGEPVMVAYQFVEDLERLKLEWPGLRWFGAGVKDATAAENERLWNRRELEVLAVHPASAGHGLNLQTGGSILAHYGLTWSAELYDQLLKRIHRPGQSRPCFSRPILMRDTIDEIKYSRVRDKISDQAAFQRLINKV